MSSIHATPLRSSSTSQQTCYLVDDRTLPRALEPTLNNARFFPLSPGDVERTTTKHKIRDLSSNLPESREPPDAVDDTLSSRDRGTSPNMCSPVVCTAEQPKLSSPTTDDARRMEQRTKQVQFGFNTDGYRNMVRLVKHDPQLVNGGVLPLDPPQPSFKTSKRTWDILVRKWRRALHMFDDVFIDGEDESKTSLEQVVEAQRQKWLNPRFQDFPKEMRVKITSQALCSRRTSPLVPSAIPLEESMKPILRSLDRFMSVESLLPESAASQTSRGNVTASDVGVKVMVAPVPYVTQQPQCAQFRGRSPSPDAGAFCVSPPATLARPMLETPQQPPPARSTRLWSRTASSPLTNPSEKENESGHEEAVREGTRFLPLLPPYSKEK